MTTGTMALVLIAALGAIACEKQAAGHEPSTFFELLRHAIHTRYTSVTGVSEMTRFSELVVVAKMVSVEEGGIALGTQTVVAKLHVSRVLKGEERDQEVYVELLRGPIATADKLNRLVPHESGVWFLQGALNSASSPLDERRGEGLPTDEVLYAPASPQGFVMESDGGLVQPLEPDPLLWLPDVSMYRSIVDISGEVESAVRESG